AKAGHYRIGVRYMSVSKTPSPFTLTVTQGGETPISGDMYAEAGNSRLVWEWAEGDLKAGPTEIKIASTSQNDGNEINLIVDAVLLTNDEKYQPNIADFHRAMFVRLT